MDQLILEKRVELDLLLKIRRDKFGDEEEDVDSDGGNENDEDDEDDRDDEEDGDDSDDGDEERKNEGKEEGAEGANEGHEEDKEGVDGGNEEDEEGNGGDMEEDVGGDDEVGKDVDRLNVEKDDGDEDGGKDQVGMDSMEVDDDAFILSPRDVTLIEGMRKTPSIKRTVLSRSRHAGPSMRSPFVPLVSRKGRPNYPGRKEVMDEERELLDNFWKENMAA